MTDIAAAIGLVQLDKLERNTARRQRIARRYDEPSPICRFNCRPAPRPNARLSPVHLGVGSARDEIVAR